MASTVASALLRAGRTQPKLSHASALRSVYTQVGTTTARTATLATTAKNGMRKPRVGVAGATGAVGIEMRKKLEERAFPMESLKLFAHPSEEGTPITFAGKEYKCESVKDGCFDDLDICLFSAGGDFSKEFAPKAAAAGCVVVDNSSVFRMDPKCPLVVPEVNPHAVKGHNNIIANPNCTTILMNVPVYPLHKAFHVERAVVSTYQVRVRGRVRVRARVDS